MKACPMTTFGCASLRGMLASLALLVAAPIGTARADEDDARRAAMRFEAGEAAFARRDFETAALAFEEAARLSPHPSAWLNAAEAWEREGRYARAAEDCSHALELSEDEPQIHREARARLDRLETKTSRLDLKGPDTIEVAIDGGERHRPPVVRWVDPGRHFLLVRAPGTDERRKDMMLEPGEQREIDLEQEIRGEERPAERPPPITSVVEHERGPRKGQEGGGPPAASWVCFAVGGAAIVAAVIFGGLTLGAQNDYEAAPTQERADSFFGRRLATNLSWGLALVGAGAGIAFWVLDGGSAPEAQGDDGSRWDSGGARFSATIRF
jgi:tetratricopeptide (TPR) repeat protein